jgi:prepilin-type N-terminal cleavage/methylation domain-containing protein
MRKGVTLLELCIVLALIALIVTLSSSFLVPSGSVRQEVERLYAAILYMQRKALLERKQLSLIFDTSRNSYHADTEHILGPGVVFGIQKNVLGPPSLPTRLLKEPITWPSNMITFYPDGTISAGAVYITDTKRSCLYALTCDASEITHVRRYRHQEKWELVT